MEDLDTETAGWALLGENGGAGTYSKRSEWKIKTTRIPGGRLAFRESSQA